jgi:ferredoxin-type protein NapG
MEKTSRRDALKKLFKTAGFLGLGGIAWAGVIEDKNSNPLVLRPPAALDEVDFIKSCLKCGACVEACPFETLKLAKPEDNVTIGTPHFKPREIPCYMCPDVPCVPVCPSGALDIKKLIPVEKEEIDVNLSQMGVAVIDPNNCLAFSGIQCDACYRACPLITKAITIEYQHNEITDKHANLKPVIHADVCTGCGACEHACVTQNAAVKIFPRAIVLGELGDFYQKSWEENDENSPYEHEKYEEENSKMLDYLNSWEDLVDD